MMRILVCLWLLFGLMPYPARADDISAAGRGVVRIVTVAIVDDEVIDFGHGSGFAVAPNRVVTNAHVVELAARYPGNVLVGVVPSEGDRSFQGRLVTVDPNRDLALIEFTGASLPPLVLYNGPAVEGETLISLGYPGNVDMATAQTAIDYIRPLAPVRSQGNFSGLRRLGGTQVLLHTAGIARGNSGGPLLDRCGRVLGVNSALTRADEGDSGFAFAIANAELGAFLREAGQQVGVVGSPCTSIEERLASDREAEERARAETEQARRDVVARAEAEREARLAAARDANQRVRENVMALAALLLVAGALSLGAAGLLAQRGQGRYAIWAAGAGGVLMLAAVIAFVLRPAFDPARIASDAPSAPATPVSAASAVGAMTCSFVPERSRVTVSPTESVDVNWGADGCVNGRTQYAEQGSLWQRILVPEGEQTVSLLQFDPATRTYTNTRYLLSAAQMAEARRLREGVELKQCSRNEAARAALVRQQAAIRAALPPLPNERLVYRCQPRG
ncbi:S1C family serine protease [Sphingomonas sp.]